MIKITPPLKNNLPNQTSGKQPLVTKILAFSRSTQRINPSLDQMRAVIAALPQLQLRAPCVLIGGTNGKGTTAGFTFSLLARAGALQVGLYTSPHVLHFCERIQVSHHALDDAALLDLWQELEELLTPQWHTQLTFFECTTLLAWHTFNRLATDFNVLEVGLGGTWDAVNICDPLAAAIVSIGKDHQRYLGNTYAAILADKIGIARPQRPLFWGNQGSGANDPTMQDTLQEIVQSRQIPLYSAAREFHCQADNTLNISLPDLPAISLPLPAALQACPSWLQHNFCLACALSWWLLPQLNRPRANFAKTIADSDALLPPSLPARFQQRVLRHRHTGQVRQLLLDACHNYDGSLALVTELKQRYGVVPGMLSLLNDKEINKIIPLLATQLAPLAIFAVNNTRSITRAQVPQDWQHCWHENITSAWHTLVTTQSDLPLVICGSFYGMGEALAMLNSHPQWQLLPSSR